jgi:type IV pilus assembly protein PilW
MEFLSKDIRMAGYWDCMNPSSPNNEDIVGTEGASAAAPDSITLRGAFVRQHDPADDCGTAVTKAATIACPKAADPANFYTDTTSIITYSINNNTLRRATNCVSNANADIVEGIENMKILYGIETDAVGSADYGTPNYYVTANNIPDIDADGTPDWDRVVSIRITITARTIDGNLTATGDGRIRRDFISTLAVRNRLP